MCFNDRVPGKNIQLRSYSDSASKQISNIKFQNQGYLKIIQHQKNSINLKNVSKGDCVLYQAVLNFNNLRRLPTIYKKDQIVTDPKQWLWYPKSFSVNDNVKITFKLPKEMNISAPWKLLDRNISETRYQIQKRPTEWDALVAIGKFTVDDINVGNSVIRYALLNGHKKVDNNKIRYWIVQNIEALTTVYGSFPVSNLQILVVPLGRGSEPVPWGQAMRGGGDAVHLYIDDSRSLSEFLDDWVLSHELSHLLHPRITREGAWLYEGMASYYQNVIRARQGLLTTQQAWKKLHAGFERGINKTPKNKTLDEVTKSMMKYRAFMRVYWSGAAISLMADVKLRRLSNNKKSLDKTLQQFKKCCLSDSRWWTAYELMNKFDKLSNSTVFTKLYNDNVFSTSFPDLTRVYSQLGLTNQNGRFKILKYSPTSIRDKIMRQH